MLVILDIFFYCNMKFCTGEIKALLKNAMYVQDIKFQVNKKFFV